MISTNDLKNGITIEYEGNIYVVMETQHVKPGKGAAIVKAKLKNLRTGSIAEYTFNSTVKLEAARIEKKPMQFLYVMNVAMKPQNGSVNARPVASGTHSTRSR